MKLVLLSGGSGRHLWPLSNDSRSKQFLKVLDGKDAQLESMVQRIWGQIGSAGLQESALIAACKPQVDMIHSQLGREVPLIIEPCRRDTFPAIALAAAFIRSVEKADLNETVTVLPVDVHTEDGFFKRVKDMEAALEESGAELALMGAAPTFPSTKHSYIMTETPPAGPAHCFVSYFVENPKEPLAREMLESGALWNCGVSAFKLGFLLSVLESKNLPIDYDELLAHYESLPAASFDGEVIEKTAHKIVVPYEGYWKKLGAWNALTEEIAASQTGSGIVCPESVNTHLINELDIPVTVIGIPNAIVAVSPDGILVADKVKSAGVKELLGGFENRPMYEERRWGWYRVLDHTKFGNDREMLTKRIGVTAGKNLSYQKHAYRSEVWMVVKGNGEFAHNDQIRRVSAGDVLEIRVGDKHGIKALTDLEFIEVQTGKELVEEDIVRIFMSWEEVEECCQAVKG